LENLVVTLWNRYKEVTKEEKKGALVRNMIPLDHNS
jgi:hypothetical protein